MSCVSGVPDGPITHMKGTTVTRSDEDSNQRDDQGGLSRRSILAGGAATALTAASVTSVAAPAFAAPRSKGRDELRVGAGKAVLTVPAATYQAEQYHDIHDDLYVRVVLAKTKTKSLVLVVFDLTSISADAIAGVRSAVTAVSGVPAADVVVTVTHNFSSPHVNPGQASDA